MSKKITMDYEEYLKLIEDKKIIKIDYYKLNQN